MGSKSEFVKVAVEPERKERWEDAVSDNPNVGTLSGLIRLAVEKEIGGTSGSDGVDEEVNEALSELVQENRELKQNQETLKSQLTEVVQAVQQDPEVSKLKSEVFAVLPRKEQFEDESLPDTIPAEHGGPVANSGEVSDIARLLETSGLQVQKAIDKLREDTSRLRETDDGRFFKEV